MHFSFYGVHFVLWVRSELPVPFLQAATIPGLQIAEASGKPGVAKAQGCDERLHFEESPAAAR